MVNQWMPSADRATLVKRAELMRRVRTYFASQNVLEVDTPMLSSFSATDVQLEQWQTTEGYALHTSPEFAMKRLLAAGSGDIYQLCHVFRIDERGRKHNPEFSMLEWYRTGMDEFDLMRDVVALIESLLNQPVPMVETHTYEEVFLNSGLPNPHSCSDQELKKSVSERLSAQCQAWTRDECLDALMAMVVEPSLPADRLVFIHQYPKSQAALAQYDIVDETVVARRFELYWQGMELANGYFELTDVEEQQRRFEHEAALKQSEGGLVYDQYLLDALRAGLPSCSGVALGFDRLVMILLGKESISEVLSFSIDRM